jgi:zinc protease
MKQLFLSLVAFCCVLSVQAQQSGNIPVDPAVRVGKLSNGLTYYIRHNALPEKRAFFYIAQKVGAIQEEPQQRGLAHFLEHMCFNGTKHFPGDSMIKYLEKIGVKFGENLNAYTSIDETVYNIDNVPTTAVNAIDSCLLILHDWSNDLLLDPKEIDKERGVINEEWRMRNNAQQRIQTAMMPAIMKGCKYEDSMPIGSMDVVMHFKPQVLRDYYEKWYRPDLQGIVIVGDINVDEIEAKIKKVFADIPAQPNGAKRTYVEVPDNSDPIVFIGKDKEMTSTSASLMFKHKGTPDADKGNMDYFRKEYTESMLSLMLNNRIGEMMHQANPPFLGARVGNDNFFVAKTEDAFEGSVSLRETDIAKGVKALYREILRAKEGFTKTEFDRIKTDYLRSAESMYNERDKKESKSYVRAYVRNFLDNAPIPSVAQRYDMIKKVAAEVTVDDVNAMMRSLVTTNNMVVTLTGPEKAGLTLPTQQQLLDMLAEVRQEKIEPYKDTTINEPLMSSKPKAGRVVSVKHNGFLGTTEMKLSNGARVILKTTDFKKDQINMSALSKGGTSLFPDNDYINIDNLGLVEEGGLGKFTNVQLEKLLTGKIANVSTSITTSEESVSANCSPKDLETMMQLVYLTFTAPHKDETAFAAYKQRLKASLKNQEMKPQTALQDTLRNAIYGNVLRLTRMKEDMVDKINYDRVLEMYRSRFADASDFTFIFVGNIDEATLKPYLEQYIASLPATHHPETAKKMLYTRKGTYTSNFSKELQVPMSIVYKMVSGDMPFSMRNNMLAGMLGEVMNMVYTKTIREDASAAYSVGVSGEPEIFPTEMAKLTISFSTAPEKKALAMKLMDEGLQNLLKNGPQQDYLDKVKEFRLKKHAEMLKKNEYWMSVLSVKTLMNTDMYTNYEQITKDITAKDLQDFANTIFKQGNDIVVTMDSKK